MITALRSCLLLSLFFIFFLLASPVMAQGSYCTYTKSCNFGEGPGSGQQTCYGSYQGASCQLDRNLGEYCLPCQMKDNTKIYIEPTRFKQGDDVTVTVTGTESCSTETELETQQGLKECRQTKATCSEPNSRDRNKCTFEYKCKADEDGNFTARFSTDNDSCRSEKNYNVERAGSQIYIEPPQIEQGEQLTIYVTADQDCTELPKLELQNGIRVQKVEKATCSEPNPKDGRKCWWQYSAVTDSSGEFEANFKSFENKDEGQTVTEKSYCASKSSYFVASARACQGAYEATASAISDRDKVIVPALDLRQQDTENLTHNLAPQSVNKTLNKNQQPTIEIGVIEGFLGPVRSLLCSTPLIRNSQGAFCKKELDLAGGKTDYFSKQAQLVAISKRPLSAQASPMPRDCFLNDVQNTRGNQILNNLSKSLGTQTGFYSIELPRVDYYPPLNDGAYPSLGGNLFKGDHRAKDIEQSCQLYTKANYPNGVGPCPTE